MDGGSSPRVRGTSWTELVRWNPVGLIPAGAGNIFWYAAKPGTRRAHPRGCGEHTLDPRFSALHWGSSPRVRGTLIHGLDALEPLGLIPAGAGNIASGRRTARARRAHPRGCGEHRVRGNMRLNGLGSSPRVRGTFEAAMTKASGTGLIPAGAGNIMQRALTEAMRGAHPRGCGEHRVFRRCLRRRGGSSPRVRGTY